MLCGFSVYTCAWECACASLYVPTRTVSPDVKYAALYGLTAGGNVAAITSDLCPWSCWLVSSNYFVRTERGDGMLFVTTCCATCPHALLRKSKEIMLELQRLHLIDRKTICWYFDNRLNVEVIFQAEILNFPCLQLLHCEDLLLFIV